jgi:hypothetical protein
MEFGEAILGGNILGYQVVGALMDLGVSIPEVIFL